MEFDFTVYRRKPAHERKRIELPYSAGRRENMTDIIVVGGGITGAAAAYEVARAGRSVLVIEKRRVAAIFVRAATRKG